MRAFMSFIFREDVHQHDHNHASEPHTQPHHIIHAITFFMNGTTMNEASPATIAVMVPVTVP